MNLYNLFEAPKQTPAQGTTGVMDNQVQSAASPIGSGTSKWEHKKKPGTMMGVGNNDVVAEARDVQLDEISNKILGDYKKAAGADATAADKAGDIERGNKRFRGIVKATVKQGENDAKRHKEQGIAEGGIATVGWPDEGNHSGNNPPVSVGGTVPARPAVEKGSLVKASGISGVHRVMDIRGDEAYIVQEIPNSGGSNYVSMSDLRVWTNKPIKEQGMAEGSELKQAKRKYNQAAKDANLDQVGAGKKIDTMKKSLRQKDLGKEQGVSESLGRATPKMPKARDPGHAVLAAKRSSGAAGQHTNKKRQAVLQPKHQKPLTRDMDLGEGWKSTLGGAALAGAMALGAGGAQAQVSGEDFLPDIVAHVKFKVNEKEVSKDINLGTAYKSPREAADALEKFLKSKGIKYFSYTLERVGDNQSADSFMDKTPGTDQGMSAGMDAQPYRATKSTKDDYMVREELDESIERRLMQMRHAGYDI